MDTAIARPDILLVADAVAREKSIDREEVIATLESAIQKAGRAKYGHEKDIRATIDRKTGDVRLSRWSEVVETVENEETQIPLSLARKIQPAISLGEFIVDPLPPIDFGRIAAQTAKQVIVQGVRDIERKRQYEEYKDRIGEIVNGIVKRTEYGNLMVDLGRAEALLRRDELIPRESFRNGDRVRAYIYDVRAEPRGPQLFLSRTHPGFLAKLFAQEVPEIYDGIIEIKAVAREKSIDREEVLEAMEQAIQKAGRAKYGHEKDIRATIDRKTGDVRLSRWTEAVETVENEETQIPIHIAAKFQPGIKVGEHLVDPLPPIDFGRIAAQTAKQVIVQRVREYERKRQFDEFKDRVGEIINGTVKRTEYGNLMVEVGRAEALLRRDELIPRESFRNGDRVRAYIYDVREELRGPQIFLSRTHPGFLAKLFAQEVPEIYDGIIEIKAVARDPGSRAKMAVISRDSSIDPVGACVGMRGSRVQAVVAEL
ncbi:MAG TPA: transcription termination factor NusA, partial [Acetobacteraceae bacterium]|nr:transcription termination factor NusA [Acetobacteraceae bacterium]